MNLMTKLWNERNYMTFVSIIGWAIIFLNLPRFSNFLRTDMLIFLALCIIASNTSIRFKSGMQMTLTSPVSIFLLLNLNMNMTLGIGCLGLLSFLLISKRKFDKIFFNLAQYTISIFLAGKVLYLFYDGILHLPLDFLFIIPAILVFELVNHVLVSIAIAFNLGVPFGQVSMDGIHDSKVALPLYLTNGLIMYICHQAYGLWGLALIIVPLFSVHWLLKASAKADFHKENSYICPTTKLKNRRCLNEWLEHEFPTTVDVDTNISFTIIDIDDFKKINDKYGHEIGDRVLEEFGNLIRTNIRDTDLIYRYGGEEFVVILPGFPEESSNIVIERLHETIRHHSFSELDLNITFSAGISSLDKGLLNDTNMNTANELIRRADMAMYVAKQSGKNQTQFFKH